MPFVPTAEVIIVDDDEGVRTAVHAVAQAGFPSAHITDYTSGLAALRRIESSPVDLLITNCDMPDMDGPTLVRTLREKRFSLPIIMVSGSPEARELGEKAGIDGFVDKQNLSTRLPSAMKALLKHR